MKQGYGSTPNKMIPLNDREKGEIAPVAMRQLARFNDAAETWPVHPIRRVDADKLLRYCNVCRVCDQNIWFDADEGNNYFQYSEAEIKALIVAHIRQRHTDDNGVIDEPSTASEILDFSSRAHSIRIDPGNAD